MTLAWALRSSCLHTTPYPPLHSIPYADTDWRWRVVPESGASRLTVSWELHPQTFWRRHLFSRLRRRSLANTEVPASVAALAWLVSTA
ncbi:hypothetical protein [Streptodolium elevatio]|uniref:Uncharacterized protein n=1 Tax=Streptodolium elevatio TaxID=3157996 RepID=A0ABV3DI94_9ACTN